MLVPPVEMPIGDRIERYVDGVERREEIARVEQFAEAAYAARRQCTAAQQADRRLDDERRADRIDVASRRARAMRDAVLHDDGVHHELLRRAAERVDRLRRRRAGIADIAQRERREPGLDRIDAQMTRERHHFRERQQCHVDVAERRRKRPAALAGRRRHRGRLAVLLHQPDRVIALAGHARAARRMPAVEAGRDVDALDRPLRVDHGRHEQVGQTAVERDGRHQRHAGGACAGVALVGQRLDGRLLGRQIEIRDTGAQRRVGERQRGIEVGARAVDHRVRAAQGGVERGRIVDRRDAPRRRVVAALREPRGIAPDAHHAEAAPFQFGDDKPPGVTGGAIHCNRHSTVHDSLRYRPVCFIVQTCSVVNPAMLSSDALLRDRRPSAAGLG